ncbi:MAG: zinc ribbon domain-containing protein [Thermodesulfobacteriota bacterium]|nr:zinc ribbon domain-containing protein [Thermodesulfobacteriota bacterium]
MAIVTREDVYNKMVHEEKPVCPHCGQEMVIWECPPVCFSDGLGWGTPYLYVCFNNDCPLYLEGWENVMDHYQTAASYRCICDPMSGRMDSMVVYSREGASGYVIDEEVRAKEEARRAAEEKGLKELNAHFEAKDAQAVLAVLLADNTPPPVAFRAAEMIGEVGGLEVIEPIRNHGFENERVKAKAEEGIALIHKKHYTKECPFCAEIIKARAVVCKYCRRDLT